MIKVATILAILLGLLHVWIMVLEVFLWNSPYGRKAFGMSHEKALATKVMAINQGVYNGFLAVGIFWGLLRSDVGVQMFFFVCIFIAGIVGALTASRKIIFVQTVPALLALITTYIAYN